MLFESAVRLSYRSHRRAERRFLSVAFMSQ